MEIPADTRRELIAQFSAIVSADAASADLATAETVVTGCQRLRGLLAARDAEFTPVVEELRHQAALETLRDPDPDPDALDDGGSDGSARGDSGTTGGDSGEDDPSDGPGRGDAAGGAADGSTQRGTGHDDGAAEPGDTATADTEAPDTGATPGGQPRPRDTGPRESTRQRRQRELRSKWLAVFDLFAHALAAGQVAPEHADRLADICESIPATLVPEVRADQRRLVRLAVGYPPDAFAINLNDWIRDLRADNGISEYEQQLAASRAWMWHDRVTGLYHLSAVFDPRRGPVVQHALDHATLRLLDGDYHHTRQQHAAQALYQLITNNVEGTGDGGRIGDSRGAAPLDQASSGGAPDHESAGGVTDPVAANLANVGALVIADYQTAITGLAHPHTVCENIDGIPLPTDIALRACAVGNVRAAILDRAGKPADLTTHHRLATAEQRDDLRAMGNQCAHPDCAQPWTRCHIHHVQFHEHDGPTAVPNLVPVCNRHHHDIHDRGWRLTIDAHRTLRWYRPDGTLYAELPHTRLDKRPVGGDPAAAPPPAGAALTRPAATSPPTGNANRARSRPTATGAEPPRDPATEQHRSAPDTVVDTDAA